MSQNDIARKMERLLVACEALRADGWEIAQGSTVDFDNKCCCPLGTIPILVGYFRPGPYALREPAIDPEDVAAEILDVTPGWVTSFIQGFEDRGVPRFQGVVPIAHAYGRTFRGLYVHDTKPCD